MKKLITLLLALVLLFALPANATLLSGYSNSQPVSIDAFERLSAELTNFTVDVVMDSAVTDFWDNEDGDGTKVRFVWGSMADGQIEDTLDGGINDSVTTITVDSTTGFPTAGRLMIGTEEIDYSGTSATTFTGATRGVNGSSAAAHSDTDVVFPLLIFELQSYNATTDDAIWSVKLPTLYYTEINRFYIHHNNGSATDGEDKENAWDSNYVAVWHMDENHASGAYDDATSNDNDGTNNGTIDIAGQVGRARDFDGDNDYVSTSDSASFDNLTTDWIIEGWFTSADTSGQQSFMLHRDDVGSNRILAVGILTSGKIYGHHFVSAAAKTQTFTSLPNPDDGELHHFALMNDGTHFYMFLDGTAQTGTNDGGTTDTGAIGIDIGRWRHPNEYHNGLIDELTLSSDKRSASWARARWMSGLGTWLSFDEVYRATVAVESGRYLAFPDMAKLDNGDWIVMYKNGVSHATDDAEAKLVYKTSDDEGATWSSETNLAIPGEASTDMNWQNGQVTTLNGRTFAFLNEYDSETNMKTWMRYTDNSGSSWSSKAEITSTTLDTSFYQHGNIIEDSSGDYLMAGWGRNGADGYNTFAILKSTNSGVDWTDLSSLDVGAGTHSEPSILRTSGSNVILKESFTNKLYKSDDDAATWDGGTTQAELPSNFASPMFFIWGFQTIFLGGRHQADQDIDVHLSEDGGDNWTFHVELDEYADGATDGGYTGFIHLDVNRYAVSYYTNIASYNGGDPFIEFQIRSYPDLALPVSINLWRKRQIRRGKGGYYRD